VVDAVVLAEGEISAVAARSSNPAFGAGAAWKDLLVTINMTMAEITTQSRIPIHPNTR
jgi:hypothetical protein